MRQSGRVGVDGDERWRYSPEKASPVMGFTPSCTTFSLGILREIFSEP